MTSNLETVTNTARAEVAPTVVQPSVTFFTTFTYWTTSIDGDETVVTSSEETRTDVLPASVTEGLNIVKSTAAAAADQEEGIRFTQRPEISPSATLGVLVQPSSAAPEIESGSVSASDVAAGNTPSLTLKLEVSSTDSFEDLDDEFTLVSASPASSEEVKSSSSSSASGSSSSSRTRTPVIRPNLFRQRNQQSARPRPGHRARTTVAIITRSDQATPTTLIATPAASHLQPTPSFGSSTRQLASASLLAGGRGGSRFRSSSSRGVSSSSIHPSSAGASISPSSTRSSEADPTRPSIISNLRLRRPNPFRARLRERQRQQLQRLRESSTSNSNEETESTSSSSAATEAQTTPAATRPTVPVPRFPVGAPGRTPIFISSRTENFSRRPKVVKLEPKPEAEESSSSSSADGSTPTASSPNSSRSTEVLRLQRERAKSRIQALFKRRRPNFLRPRPTSTTTSEDQLVASESRLRRRQKRQVGSNYYSEFGARTRKRQAFIQRQKRQRRPSSSSSSSSSSSNHHRQPEYFETLETPPFTAFPGYTSDDSSSSSSSSSFASAQQSPALNAYENYYDDYNSRQLSSSPGTSSSSNSLISDSGSSSIRASNNVRRQVDSSQSSSSSRSRSRSRFNPNRGRTRLRTRPTSSQAQTEPPPTTTQRSFSRSRFRPRTLSSSSSSSGRGSNRFQSSSSSSSSSSGRFGSSPSFRRTTKPPRTSLFDYDDYDYDYSDTDIQSSQNANGGVPDSITVTHQVPFMTVIPVRENGRDELRDILTQSPSLEVIAATALKSTDVDGKPVIYANTEVNEVAPGTRDVTYEALRATETTTIVFTPTKIRGFRTRFSHVVPSTIYNIKPVTTRVVEPVDQNQLLSQLLLTLLGPNGLKNGAQNPLASGLINPTAPVGNLPPVATQPPPTQFVTHTNTFVTTITNTESTVLPITLRGREIKTTLVESITEVVTATEFSTETIINQVNAGPTQQPQGLPFGFPQQQQQQPVINQQPQQPIIPPELQQQLLAAQLQQQLRAQQQQLLNQQLLSQVNLDLPANNPPPQQQQVVQPPPQQQQPQPIAATQAPPAPVIAPDPPAPRTSVVTKFVSGKSPGEFHVVTSVVTLEDRRRKREAATIAPSATVDSSSVEATRNPSSSSPISPSPISFIDENEIDEFDAPTIQDSDQDFFPMLESSLGASSSSSSSTGPSSTSSSWTPTPTSGILDSLTTLLL